MTERIEERLLKFISGLLALIIENMWSFVFIVWAATSIFSLDDIVFVKPPAEKAKVEHVEKESSDGPKPSF